MFKIAKTIGYAAVMIAMAGAPAFAADYTVEMKNKCEAGIMVFEPALTKVQPGDTVTFVSTDKGHNAETIKGLIPEGAEPFKSKINADITVTFDVPGAYAIKCAPHLAMGMVAVVVVGDDTSNVADITAAKFPKKATDRFAEATSGL